MIEIDIDSQWAIGSRKRLIGWASDPYLVVEQVNKLISHRTAYFIDFAQCVCALQLVIVFGHRFEFRRLSVSNLVLSRSCLCPSPPSLLLSPSRRSIIPKLHIPIFTYRSLLE